MKKTLASFLLLLLFAFLSVAQSKRTVVPKTLAFTHVTVIDTNGAGAKPDMTVIIARGRIIRVGKSKQIRPPQGAHIIDATGKFLIPGLWDMHTHLGTEAVDQRSHLPLFIANGITGIRVMSGEPEHHQWRKAITSETLLGPRMVIANQSYDEAKTSPAQAREQVRKAEREGADFMKVYDNLSRDAYYALVDEAKKLGLPVVGHVPNAITAQEASEAGQKSIEHSTGLDAAKSDDKIALTLATVFKKNHTWLCPTLIMRHNYTVLDDTRLAEDPRLKYIKPAWRTRWANNIDEARSFPATELPNRRATVAKEIALTGKMQKAGVGILAGTDEVNPYTYPGFSLHDELALLVEGGLTPMQALQTATLNPAKFFGRLDSLGTIETGKLADMVLLDGNPLQDIHNTSRINAVVVNGRLLNRNDLDKLFAEIESAAKGQ